MKLDIRRYGATGGFPVVLHHGLAGSAQDGAAWTRAARKANVELISVARPGYGRSQPVDMKCIAEWADIVTTVLGTHYGVWAVSAGAPYAYALAAAQPKRVTAVAVTSGLGRGTDWTALRDSPAHDAAHDGAGPGREAVLQQRPWGFDLAAITVPVRLWHSAHDPMVPLRTAQQMRNAIPGAKLCVQDTAQHVPSDDVVADALDYLAGGENRH